MTKSYIPVRGDIVWLELDPTFGHEQARRRPALVLSPKLFNEASKLMLVAPITSTVRKFPFEVEIDSDKTQGVVLSHQVRTVDYQAREVEFIEKSPASVLAQVLAKVQVLLK